MPDPVANMDVEDVLSSIRRLVSEEAKGHPAGPDAHLLQEDAESAADQALTDSGVSDTDLTEAGTPPSNDYIPDTASEDVPDPKLSFRHQAKHMKPSGPDRLVLTSAFRVQAEVANAPETEVTSPDATEADVVSLRVQSSQDAPEIAVEPAETGLEDVLTLSPSAEVAAPMDEADQAPQEEAAVAPVRPLRPELRAVRPEPAEAQATPVIPEAPVEMVPPADEDMTETPTAASDEVELPELEADPDPSQTFSASYGETDEATPEEDAALLRARAFDVAPDDRLFDRARAAMEAAGSDAVRRPARPVSGVTETPGDPMAEAVAEAIGRAQSDLAELNEADNLDQMPAEVDAEPSGSVFGDPSAFAGVDSPLRSETAEETAEESDVEAAAETGVETDVEEVSVEDAVVTADETYDRIDFTGESEAVLDEEALRDMVEDIVREVLQGELGDRITRNVRKLVRREIQRAMASREFE